MKILKNYIEDNKMRLLDLFNTLDKDKSMNITVKEFADGLKVRSLSDLFQIWIVGVYWLIEWLVCPNLVMFEPILTGNNFIN